MKKHTDVKVMAGGRFHSDQGFAIVAGRTTDNKRES
jgi:hypothetical protein